MSFGLDCDGNGVEKKKRNIPEREMMLRDEEMMMKFNKMKMQSLTPLPISSFLYPPPLDRSPIYRRQKVSCLYDTWKMVIGRLS